MILTGKNYLYGKDADGEGYYVPVEKKDMTLFCFLTFTHKVIAFPDEDVQDEEMSIVIADETKPTPDDEVYDVDRNFIGVYYVQELSRS